MKVEKERWIAIDGGIYTEKIFDVKCELSSNKIKARYCVAFNVGRAVAEHIVRLHNIEFERTENE